METAAPAAVTAPPVAADAPTAVRDRLLPYAVAVGATLAAFALRSALTGLIGQQYSYATFYFSVSVAAFFGGWRPGLLAAVAGYFLGATFLSGGADLIPRTLPGAIGATLYAFNCAVMIAPAEAMRQARAQAEAHARDADRAAAALSETEARARLILDSALDAVIIMDEAGRIADWNPRAEAVFGWTRAEAVGRTLAELIVPPALRDAHARGLAHFLATGEGPVLNRRTELPALRRDGTEFPIELTPFALSVGGRHTFCAFVRDITDRKQAEAEREALNAALRRAMRETHHRVKNNLQVVAALSEMQAQEGGLIPASSLGRIASHVRSLATLHDILTGRSGFLESADDESLPSGEFFDKLLPLLQASAGNRPLRAAFHDGPVTPKQASALALLANELISNAVKHGRGEIAIVFEADGPARARLEVGDEGPGFPPDFDPRKAANTGLDLIDAVARFDLGGSVRFENRAEGGARIVVEFPVTLGGP